MCVCLCVDEYSHALSSRPLFSAVAYYDKYDETIYLTVHFESKLKLIESNQLRLSLFLSL